MKSYQSKRNPASTIMYKLVVLLDLISINETGDKVTDNREYEPYDEIKYGLITQDLVITLNKSPIFTKMIS